MVAVSSITSGRVSRVRIGDLGFDAVDGAAARKRIEELVASGQPNQVATANLRFLTLANRDEQFRQLVNSASLVVADGMPVIWASRIAGSPLPARVTGVTLLEMCCELAVAGGHSMFLLGAKPGVADEAARRLRQKYPGLNISGARDGYFKPEETSRVVERISQLRPQFLFVAMGCPKQDYWIAENLAALGVPVCIGVGGTFEIITGNLKRAPGWMQRWGLEWLYRMQQEPRRLWRRYLLEDLPTGVKIGTAALWQRVRNRGRAI